MKKSFEKFDLFKIVGLTILLVTLLSWLIPQSNFNGSEMIVGEITRIGLNDFLTCSLLSLYYFSIIVTLLLIIGGFYQVLSKTSGYQAIVTKLTKKLKGKEIAFVLIVSFVIAALSSICNEYFHLLVFIPFITTILLRLKLDKIVAFCATYGAILIGIIGTTFNTAAIESLNSSLSLDYTSNMWTKVALFAFTYVLFNFFTVMRILKLKKNKKAELDLDDRFEVEEPKEKKNLTWPVWVVFGFVFVLLVLGYINWSGAFKVTAFNDFHTWFSGLSIGESPVVSYIFGTMNAFGSWDLYMIQIILIVATCAIALIYKVKFDSLLKSFAEGAKKMLKPIIIILLVYIVCVLSVLYPVLPTITDWIMSLCDKFNVYLAAVSALINSLFGVEMRYVVSGVIPYFTAVFGGATNSPIIAVVFQSMYGLIQFVAPTSLFLMLGLSTLDIKFKSWIKYIWIFALAMLAICVAILTFITYI